MWVFLAGSVFAIRWREPVPAMIPAGGINSGGSSAVPGYLSPQHGGMASNPPPHPVSQKRLLVFQAEEGDSGSGHMGADGMQSPRRKGRKKSYIWSHTVLDENGKVHCKHCNVKISVKYGEKVERLRRHFVKNCPKSPFSKDSKEYEELLDSLNAPTQDTKKRSAFSMVTANSRGNNRIVSHSIGYVATMLTTPAADLSPEQITKLESQGNRSPNWAAIKLTGTVNSYDLSLERIRNCYFGGSAFIGVFVKNVSMEHNVSLPSGLYNSNFMGTCIFSDNSYVNNCSAISNVFLGRNSCLVGCGTVVCEGSTSYGTTQSICVGSEGKNASEVQLNVTASYGEVCAQVIMGSKRKEDDKNKKSNRSDDYIRFDMSIICDEVEVKQCDVIRNVFVGSYSKITSSGVNNCTILTHCVISHSLVADCVMHNNTSITTQSQAEGVLLFSQAHIAQSAKVQHSVLGPDSSVSVGECKKSLVGPMVGFHHQSLLIATVWPMGRGNLAYGSMVGANHTGMFCLSIYCVCILLCVRVRLSVYVYVYVFV
ncbi:DUF4954 family protein [archaeon]|nr:MAG: DUF4954 family protein [archaeon]